MQRAGELTEIKTFTGEKTLMNAVALVLHTLLYDAGGIYLCVLRCSMVHGGGKDLKKSMEFGIKIIRPMINKKQIAK